MVSNLRRLAADHGALHNAGLPPNYVFPPSSAAFPDDLTQLTILLTGPQWTPYSQGLWKLHLRIPEDYPHSPPKASFRTRIWHPNVEESTGAVCVDTLKKDWEQRLTLRDVLITISCLLIYPNPDSALNSAAGALLQDDYEAFSRQARLMTSIHAPIPNEMKEAVVEAKGRGEEPGNPRKDEDGDIPGSDKKTRSFSLATRQKSSTIMKKKPFVTKEDATKEVETLETQPSSLAPPAPPRRLHQNHKRPDTEMGDGEEEDDDGNTEDDHYKENDPSLSPSPVIPPPPLSPRKGISVLGKRPLSVLSAPSEPELVLVDTHDDGENGTEGLSASERNIVANLPPQQRQQQNEMEIDAPETTGGAGGEWSQLRKSSKLSEVGRSVNVSSRARGEKLVHRDMESSMPEMSNLPKSTTAPDQSRDGMMVLDENMGKENLEASAIRANVSSMRTKSTNTPSMSSGNGLGKSSTASRPATAHPSSGLGMSATGRKISSGVSKQKAKPRIGVRRL